MGTQHVMYFSVHPGLLVEVCPDCYCGFNTNNQFPNEAYSSMLMDESWVDEYSKSVLSKQSCSIESASSVQRLTIICVGVSLELLLVGGE